MNIDNLTPFAADCLPFMDVANEDTVLVVVAGRFALPGHADGLRDGELAVHPEQRPVPLHDVYVGEPGRSSLYWEGQASCARPGTDIYLQGHAQAPRGEPVTELDVALRVGATERRARVFGDRVWRRGLWGLRISAPAPFVRMPLCYERSLGGWLPRALGRDASAVERNPVGRGLYPSVSEAEGQPLPNLEDPQALIRSPEDHPLPQGFGPVARGWMPRRAFAGRFDPRWQAEHAPLWPSDTDPRFFSAASPGLLFTPHLEGGEEVRLIGLHPEGPLHFRLPKYALAAKLRFTGHAERQLLRLEAIMFEPDEQSLTMIWRANLPLRKSLLSLRACIVRVVAPWERSLAA